MEFQPAHKAYQRTPYEGFRTFIRWKFGKNTGYYEPFSPLNQQKDIQRTMSIGISEFAIRDENPVLGLDTKVVYFTLPGEAFAALVRSVTMTNIGDEFIEIEILDGMPALIPFGVDNMGLKAIGRTLEAWMQVVHHESGLPFFRLGATPGDTAEVDEIKAGHFALGFVADPQNDELLPTFVDPAVIFGANTSLSTPELFIQDSLEGITQASQITVGKTPCAFFGHKAALAPGESIKLNLLFGHVNRYEQLLKAKQHLFTKDYFTMKRTENQQLVQTLTDVVTTKTGDSHFDVYTRQTFLDNLLRGGWPVFLGDEHNPNPFYIFSRKHGDPERDYNHFLIKPEFFSQGNGNFRDVCQNRRNDVLFEPRVGDHNIRTFLNLIQLDGYNPLVLQGTSFTLPMEDQANLLELTDSPEQLSPFFQENFTPGGLFKHINDHDISLKISHETFINKVLENAQPHQEAAYGEGFWIDHWTYILDLIENYLIVYPDQKNGLLYGAGIIPFFQSPARVRPRSQRYILTEHGIRQYHAVAHGGESGWVRRPNQEIYTTTIIGKLILLAVIKFGTRDPEGMGIEMEAGKPGWYDALNGLPGLFGSSIPEACELLRLIRFLRASFAELNHDLQIALPKEFADYLFSLAALTEKETDPFRWWETANDLREGYREIIYQQISGQEIDLSSSTLDNILATFESHIEAGLQRAQAFAKEDIPPTYFRYEITKHEILVDEDGKQKYDELGRPYISVKGFRPIPLPLFLEGAVRALKVTKGKEQARRIYTAVKDSALYDQLLKMYKVNAPLADEPHEIGRARVFTPGWLENESIWLHMAYKYLLEVLKAGLYEEFFKDFKDSLIPFQPPERYGRSPLENSSFLVSSAHPDTSLHGVGFVARLSGATAEFLSIWHFMMVGKKPFFLDDGELCLKLMPILPGWLFTQTGEISFKFLGSCFVTYHNPKGVDIINGQIHPQSYMLHWIDGSKKEILADSISGQDAEEVRSGKIICMDIYFENQR